jgi:aminopeptidase-like protein
VQLGNRSNDAGETHVTDTLGARMLALISELFPLPRSITGEGLRETLRLLQRTIPLEIREVPTGTRVLDWEIPKEWVIREAWIRDEQGTVIADFAVSNLHVVNYSVPVRTRMSLDELRPHLHSLPDRPRVIPYRTSYYTAAWGFCLAHEQLSDLKPGQYDVLIDSELRDGHLSYGELLVPGAERDEILISAHTCHPSLANDNLSGIAVATCLAERLLASPARLSVRFLFAPGTIGSLAWLSANRERLRVRAGLVLAGIGDAGPFTYKRSFRGDATVDRAVALALRDAGEPYVLQPWSPWGYDERQYNAPGFRLPVGLLMRTPHGTYPEYHTSADDLSFVRTDRLAAALDLVEAVVRILEQDVRPVNLVPHGEPQLGRRGLYASVGGVGPGGSMALLWLLSMSDGNHSLLDIAETSGLPWPSVVGAADALRRAGLLE